MKREIILTEKTYIGHGDFTEDYELKSIDHCGQCPNFNDLAHSVGGCDLIDARTLITPENPFLNPCPIERA